MGVSTETPAPTRHLLLYDGVCALCNRSVRFLLRIDSRKRIFFAPLQGETAAGVRARHRVPETLDSMILVTGLGDDDETVHAGSTAVLTSLAVVGGLWRVVSWLRIVPRPLRDLVYRWVARHRYRWFGRHESCPIPPPEVTGRFLD